MINSVCLCITFKCDLACRHCFVSAGPSRTEEMTLSEIAQSIDNCDETIHRLWFSGGEPTVVMDKLLFGLRYARDKKKSCGYPQKICVQTNGNFAKSDEEAIRYLLALYKNGTNEIDITSNDRFHYEQMDSNIPKHLAHLANSMGIFENISIGGSDYKVVKKFGRAKNINDDEIKDFDLKYTRKCVFTGTDFVIHPNGNVLPCIYGFENFLGNILVNKLSVILNKTENRCVCAMLKDNGIFNMIEQDNLSISREDICDMCNRMILNYKNKKISRKEVYFSK